MLDDEAKAKRTLRSIIEMAQGNFPRNTDIRIETCGCDPKASMTIPSYMLSKLLRGESE